MTGAPEDRRGGESRLERRLWIAAYVVIVLAIGAGALRRLYVMFG